MNYLKKIFFWILFPFAACLNAQTVNEFIAMGDAALRNGDLQAARQAYTQARVISPDNPDANFMRALTLIGDLFENPTSKIENTLQSWEINYNRDLYEIATKKILVVIDQNSFRSFASEALQDFYDVEDWYAGSQGIPTLNALQAYDAIIWDLGDQGAAGGNGGSLNSTKESLLTQFLDNGGQLLLVGSNVLDSASPNFRSNTLHVGTFAAGAGGEPLSGFSGDPITDGMAQRLFPKSGNADTLTVASGAIQIFSDPSGAGRGLRYEDTASGGRLVVLPDSFINYLPRINGEVKQEYEVWGTNMANPDENQLRSPESFPEVFTRLGESSTTDTFPIDIEENPFNYFLIRTRGGDRASRIDAVQGFSDVMNKFYAPSTHLNVLDVDNIGSTSEPDNKFGILGPIEDRTQDFQFSTLEGYIFIDAFEDSLTNIMVHTVDGDPWPWDAPNNGETLLERSLDWFGVPKDLSVPSQIPETALSVNDTFDEFGSDLKDRIDLILQDHLSRVESAGTSWRKTITPDMVPPGFRGTQNLTFNHNDILAAQAGLNFINFAFNFLRGYDLNISYSQVTDSDFQLTDNYWNTEATSFFTARSSASFSAAKDSIIAGVGKEIDGITALQASPNNGTPVGIVDFDENSLNDFQEVKDILDQVLLSFMGSTLISHKDIDPIMVNLENLFDTPLDRTDIEDFTFDNGDNIEDVGENEFDFDSWMDPQINGIFPEQTKKAQWYSYITGLEGVPILVTNNDMGGAQINWGSDFFVTKSGGDPETFDLDFNNRDFLFSDRITEFKVFRKVDSGDEMEIVVPPIPIGNFQPGETWQYVDPAAPISGTVAYRVEIDFTDPTNLETLSTEAVILDRDGLPDKGELFYFDTLEFGDDDDPDLDKVKNVDEFAIMTNPNEFIDQDFDGLPDDWEVFHFGNRETYNGNDNPDMDLLTNAQEFALGLLPNVPDINVDAFDVSQEWNLLSIPAGVSNPTLTGLFENKFMGSSWRWQDGQFHVVGLEEPLNPTEGIWVYFLEAGTILFTINQ